jgi:hypothetical protein
VRLKCSVSLGTPAINQRMLGFANNEIQRMWKEVFVMQSQVLSQNLFGGTEEYNETPQSGQQVSRQGFEAGMSRVQSSNHSTVASDWYKDLLKICPLDFLTRPDIIFFTRKWLPGHVARGMHIGYRWESQKERGH